MIRPYERMIKYCKVYTTSEEDSQSSPSSARQFDLAKILKDELISIGVSDVELTDNCIVYGKIPATEGKESLPKIGFIAHVDTVPDFCGEGVEPQVIENYNGEDILLPKCGRVIRVKDFPHLAKEKGKTIVTASGDTLLGADDKAGVAEIVCLAEKIISEKIPHGAIRIAFTPDEEVGRGVESFDIQKFDADYAYTLDGSGVGEIVWGCFNASSAKVTVKGTNVHPGSAKGIMVNASLVAMEFNQYLPAEEIPSKTEGIEGFYHLMAMSGNVEQATLGYILRDHDEAILNQREEKMREAAAMLNQKYGEGTVEVQIRSGYRNMATKVREHFEVVEKAVSAIEKLGLKIMQDPIRGGTDGANLTARGLPCPNLGTGCYGFHGPYEHAVAEDMDTAVEIMLGIIKEFE